MLSPHHLPQLIPDRIQAALNRLQAGIWESQQPVCIEATEARAEQRTLTVARTEARHPVEACSFWGRLFDQRWCRVLLPTEADENTWLHWMDQGEATLYVEEKPFFGFNVAHRACRLPAGIREVWVQSSCVQSAIWHPEANGMDERGSYFQKAFIASRNDAVWAAFHDLKCLFDVAMDLRAKENPLQPPALSGAGLKPVLEHNSPEYRILLRRMDEAVRLWETEGIESMRESLAETYGIFRREHPLATCVLTGHAHVDLVWIWPERIGELKAVNVFATMNRLMEEYPEFRFAYSQPASYEAVRKREPALLSDIRKRISSGQWEATGAMYVESDTIFACGEALARSFLVGQEEFRGLCGQASKLTWLPDVFGYSACLPQIMRQTGVEYFFTTKMTWNAINRFPHSSFIWRGNDGSEVLSHVTQESGYVTHMEIRNVKAPMEANQQADLYPEYLLPTGYGDGGGGPTDAMIERARRLDSLAGMPAIRWDQPEAFFERLATVRDRLPIHQGECYLEYHRGTYTTHGGLKASFRRLERALQVAESVAALKRVSWDLQHAWKRQIFAQFHDYIPGSSVWDVYREGLPELNALAGELEEKSRAELGGGAGIAIFNPHAMPVKKWISAEAGAPPVFVSLPPLSGKNIEDARIEASEAPEAATVSDFVACNGLAEFRLNSQGWVESLAWEGIEVPLRSGAGFGQLILYPDRASNFESWDIDRHVLSMGTVCDASCEIERIAEPHRAGFAVTRSVGAQSRATVRFLLESGSPLLHIEIDLDWQEPEALLKLYLPTQYAAPHARFGIPFGSVLRPQLPGGMTVEALWEVPFNRHLAVFDEGEREGMFVVSEAKYGATVREGRVGVSLVRSPRVTGMEAHSFAWPPELTRLENCPVHSDLGEHSIRLAVGRYAMDLPRERQPASVAETLFTPPVVYRGSGVESPLLSITGGETLIPSWVKPSEAGAFVLRLHEVAGQRGRVSLETRPGWKTVLTNLDESVCEACNGEIAFAPYQIVSVKIVPDGRD